jgi:ADP-ribose pyrophosphatase
MSKIVHENGLFKVEESEVMVHKKKLTNHKILEDDIVVILPITKNGNILLEKQFRSGLNRELLELPAGHINKGEDPYKAAMRELEEETGFKANKLTFMTYFYSAPGILSKRESLYVAEDLVKGSLNLDPDEVIEVQEISLDKCIKMVESNKIIDAKSIIALLYYEHLLSVKQHHV